MGRGRGNRSGNQTGGRRIIKPENIHLEKSNRTKISEFSGDHPVVVPTVVDPSLYDLERLKEAKWQGLNDFRNSVLAKVETNGFQPEPARRPEADETRIVVSDIHGNYRNLYRMLLAAGAINEDGSRNPGFWICQLGDIIHGGHDVWQADKDTILLGSEWIDCQLIGNHDLAHLTQRIDSSFAGKHASLDSDISGWLASSFGSGSLRVSVDADGWLISHAGLDPRVLPKSGIVLPEGFGLDSAENDSGEFDTNLSDFSDSIEEMFFERLTNSKAERMPIFDWIGKGRGSFEETGSLFWCDINELQKGRQSVPNGIKQIIGHTPIQGNPSYSGGVWATDATGIDEGSGVIASLVKGPKREKDDWEPLVLERADRPDPLSYSDQISKADTRWKR